MVIVIAHTIHHGEYMDYLLTLDRVAFLWINNQWATPPYLDAFFPAIPWLGNGWIIFALKRPAFLHQHLPWIICHDALKRALHLRVKKMIPRSRPLRDFAPLIEAGKIHIHVLVQHLWYHSFPWGHAQAAFAVGVSLLLPRGAPVSSQS